MTLAHVAVAKNSRSVAASTYARIAQEDERKRSLIGCKLLLRKSRTEISQ